MCGAARWNPSPRGNGKGPARLGCSFLPTLRLVVVPQAVSIALAPTVGFMVQIIKGTSLAYIIGFTDLMTIGKRWANAPVAGTEPYIIFPLMALIYFALCFPAFALFAPSGTPDGHPSRPCSRLRLHDQSTVTSERMTPMKTLRSLVVAARAWPCKSCAFWRLG